MTEEQINRGIVLNNEIKTLRDFTKTCRNCWKILRINKATKIRLKTSYGCLYDDIKVSHELSERILATIEQYISEKEAELESL